MACALHVYRNGRPLGSLKVLPSSVKIHGIRSIEKSKRICKLLVFGSKYIQVVDVDMETGSIIATASDALQFADWIKDAALVNDESGNCLLYVVYAHNFVQKWRTIIVDRDQISAELLEERSCDERCLLYAARILWLPGHQEPLIISGTVFSQILLWFPFGSNPGLVKRLDGHEGVVFNIDAVHDNQLLCLTSVSDDRTVRFWRLSLNEFQLLYSQTMFGHTARVWDAKYIPETQCILSCSEDSTAKLWDVRAGKILKTWKLFKADCWCIGLNKDKTVFVAGGVAGELAVMTIESKGEVSRMAYECGMNIKSCLFMSPNMILCFMKNGYLKLFDPASQRYLYETNLGFEGCCIVLHSEVVHHDEIYYMMLMDDNNHLGLLRYTGGHLQYDELFCIADEGLYDLQLKYSSKTLFAILHSYQNDCHFIDVYKTPATETKYVEGMFKHRVFLQVPNGNFGIRSKSRHQCPSTAIGQLDQGYCVLATGGSFGHVSLFLISFKTNDCLAFLDVGDVHNSQTVTNVRLHEKGKNTLILSSCGRDGSVAKHEIRIVRESIFCQLVNRLKLTKGWLEKFVNSNCVVALQDRSIILYDITDANELCAISMRNSRNVWDICGVGEGVDVCHIDQGSLIIDKLPALYDNCVETLYPKFHYKQSRCFKLIDIVQGTSILVTGGDDALIMIYMLQEGAIEHVITIKKHAGFISSVDSIPLITTGNHMEFLLFSAGAKEEMFAWKLRLSLVDDRWVFVDYVEFAQCPLTCFIRDTRIMNLSVTRFQDIILLGVLYSDGYFRLWRFRQAERKFFNLGYLGVGRSCPLRVHTMQMSHACLFYITDTAGYISLLEVDEPLITRRVETDLELCLRDVQISEKPVRMQKQRNQSLDKQLQTKLKVHQSGINALDIIKYDQQDMTMIATGGDDGAVSVLMNDMAKCQNIELVATDKSAHASTVTAVKLVVVDDEILLISASIDQWLCVWKCDHASSNVRLIKKYRLDIADISGMQIANAMGPRLTVYLIGSGMQSLLVEIE